MDTSFAQRRRRDLIVAVCLAAVAALVPLFVKDVYVQNIMVLTLMYAALSQSWNILGGYCGQISLGHALYFGLGAYTTALLFTKFGVLPWFGMLGGGLISALIAMALGYPCFRLRGHYFVIATIVIAEIALLLFQNWEWAGAALGIDKNRVFALGWGLGAALVGLSGAIMAMFFYIYPDVGASFALIAYVTVALGGFGSVFGAFAGGIIVGLVEATTALIMPPSLKSVGIYAVYLLVVFVRPRGLFGSM